MRTHANESTTMTQAAAAAPPEDRTILIVDDDHAFAERLARALAQRGFSPSLAFSVAEALAKVASDPPRYAVIDLKLGDGGGLDAMRALKERRPDSRAIILTGYGAIASAVTAVKLGAFDYLSKPANADEIVAALMNEKVDAAEAPEAPMSADRVRWEHIQRVYESCEHNVSETARQLRMHRRTLQRILAKRAPR